MAQLRHLIVLLLAFMSVCVSEDVKRMNGLDYLNVETVEYYLSKPEIEYDVGVLFYANWCKNCHSFAQIWGQITKLLNGGSQESRLVIGLFDCEASEAHQQVCEKARVVHYPTIGYFTFAGNKISRKEPKHLAHYAGGNWQYGDAVLDWVKVMSGISRWHRMNWGARLRSFLLRKKGPPKPPLPMGTPNSMTAQKDLSGMETNLNLAQTVLNRTSTFVETLLMPILIKDTPMVYEVKNYTDVYAMLYQYQSWDSTKTSDVVLRTCATEIASDYCTRLANTFMESWLEDFPVHAQITDADFGLFKTDMENHINANEPYCGLIEECYASSFAEPKCRPETCPFKDRTVCRYATACLTDQLQLEYAEALNLDFNDESTTVEPPTQSATGTKSTWGF